MMPRFVCSVLFAASVACVQAAEDPRLSEVVVADEARIAAMLSPTQEALDGVLSDELRYAHSNGVVDTKASFVESLVQGKLRYLELRYEDRSIAFPAPGIALMTGRVQLKAKNATGDVEATLMYLAVWRNEGGRWRFLAWQSCRLPTPVLK